MKVVVSSLSLWMGMGMFVQSRTMAAAFVLPHPTTTPPISCCVSRPPTVGCGATTSSGDQETTVSVSRRDAFARAAMAVSACSALQIPFASASQALENDEKEDGSGGGVPISATWFAADGLNKETSSKTVQFDLAAYQAMRDDPSRTPLFEKAIQDRLKAAPGGPSSQTVLDLGTGPFALFAILAAQAGAKKVYAIEGDPETARTARYTIQRAGYSNVITVLEGFSTNLPYLSPEDKDEKVNFVVAEIVGSIASEEGAYASVLDAQRFVKDPTDPASWIPNRIQTYAAPASYTLHNMFQPPEFDWTKLEGEPVRFNCRDQGLQLLSDPILVEDISFADIQATTQQKEKSFDLVFTVDAARVEGNEDKFFNNLRGAQVKPDEASVLAKATASSLSGIAFWPRLILDAQGTNVVNSRRYPTGGGQRSHWQTVLPIMATKPVGGLKGGEKIAVTGFFDLSDKVEKQSKYRLSGTVFV